MPKELFNQTIKTTLNSSDRVAVGIPGQIGCDNITAANMLKQTGNWNIIADTFTNADLVAGTLTINHAKNTLLVRMVLRNPGGYEQNLAGMLHIVDTNNVDIEFGGDIEAGDWTYILEYILL